jgi:WD40 repeat protein
LLGVATPTDLIDDALTTPFNIGTRVELADFGAGDADGLTRGLGRDPEAAASLLGRVLHWTAGQPYLTQRVCSAIAEDETVVDLAGVDTLCAELFFTERAQEQDDNLQFVRNQMLGRDLDHAALLNLYRGVLSGKTVRHEETSPLVSILLLSGIARVRDGSLHIRNRVYERVFDMAWIRESMPGAELRRQRAAFRKGLLQAGAVGIVIVAAMAMLASLAHRQTGRARVAEQASVELLAQVQADKGQLLLENGDMQGLLHLVAASRSAVDMPELEEQLATDWAYWLRPTEGRLVSVVGHDAPMTGMVVNPDGSLMLTAAEDGSATMWRTETGLPLWHVKHPSPVGGDRWADWWRDRASEPAQFSTDGKRFTLSSADGLITVWDADTGSLFFPALDCGANGGSPFKVNIGVDGDIRAMTHNPGVSHGPSLIWRWDGESGDLVSVQELPYGADVHVGFLPGTSELLIRGPLYHPTVIHADTLNERWVLDTRIEIGSYDAGASIIAFGAEEVGQFGIMTRDGELRGYLPSGGSTNRARVQLSGDDRTVAVSCDDGVRLFSVSGDMLDPALLSHSSWPAHVAFNADDSLLATAVGVVVRVWNTETKQLAIEPLHHTTPISGLAFHPTSPHLLATRPDGASARLWDVGPTSGYVPALPDAGVAAIAGGPDSNSDGPSHVTFDPSGRLLASFAKRGRAVRLWDVARGAPAGQPLTMPAEVLAIAFSADGATIAASRTDGVIYIVDIDSGEVVQTGRHGYSFSLAFQPGSHILASGGIQSGVAFWDTSKPEDAAGKWLASRDVAYLGVNGAIAFHPSLPTVALANNPGRVTTWNPTTLERQATLLSLPGVVDCIRFSPDGTLLATACQDNTGQVWDATTGLAVGPPLQHTARVEWISFSPDGRHVVTAGRDNVAQVWDVHTGRRVGAPWHNATYVYRAEFSPDGQHLATSGVGEVRLWTLPTPPENVAEMERRTWLETGARLNADGEPEAIAWREWRAAHDTANVPR